MKDDGGKWYPCISLVHGVAHRYIYIYIYGGAPLQPLVTTFGRFVKVIDLMNLTNFDDYQVKDFQSQSSQLPLRTRFGAHNAALCYRARK